MSPAPSLRRLSRIPDLDRAAIKQLCDLHPWELGQLCADVGLDKTVLSNFFAGRRPFPQKLAPLFLRQIGLTAAGEVDVRHCFVFQLKAGMQDLAIEWLKRLFPGGGRKIELSNTAVDHERPQRPVDQQAYGVALFDDRIAAVVRDDIHFGDHSWIPGKWSLWGHDDSADGLLSLDNLPTKADVMAAMNSLPQYDEVVWRYIKEGAMAAGLSGDAVLAILKQEVPNWPEPAFIDNGTQGQSRGLMSAHSRQSVP